MQMAATGGRFSGCKFARVTSVQYSPLQSHFHMFERLKGHSTKFRMLQFISWFSFGYLEFQSSAFRENYYFGFSSIWKKIFVYQKQTDISEYSNRLRLQLHNNNSRSYSYSELKFKLRILHFKTKRCAPDFSVLLSFTPSSGHRIQGSATS